VRWGGELKLQNSALKFSWRNLPRPEEKGRKVIRRLPHHASVFRGMRQIDSRIVSEIYVDLFEKL